MFFSSFFITSLFPDITINVFFFFNDTATTEIYTLSLHDALPIGARGIVRAPWAPFGGLWLHSLLRGEPLRDAIAALVPARSFAELRTPLLVTAVDLDSGDLIRFGAGGESAPLVDALWASCALPVFYPPVSLGGRR